MNGFTSPFPPIDAPGGTATQAPAGGSSGLDIFGRAVNLATSVFSLYQKSRAMSKSSDDANRAAQKQAKLFKRSLRTGVKPVGADSSFIGGAPESNIFGPLLLIGGAGLLAVVLLSRRSRHA